MPHRLYAAGNVVSAGGDSFSRDWNGRLTSATVGGVSSSSTYDGDYLRVVAQSGGATRHLWDGTDLVCLVPALRRSGAQSPG